MLDLQGFWLNLDRCGDRAVWMQTRLSELGLSAQYQRVAGVEGDADEASRRALKPGEWGAWQGWLRMLECASESSAAFVHLLEDDVDISDSLLGLLDSSLLHDVLRQGKIVCTDAYINPRQSLELLRALGRSEGVNKEWLVITRSFKIPCLNSIFLTPATAELLRLRLKDLAQREGLLKPVDVAFDQASDEWCTIAPFVTAPKLELSSRSGIHGDSEDNLLLSRTAISLLRRSLFCKDNDHDLKVGIADLMMSLVEIDVLKPF